MNFYFSAKVWGEQNDAPNTSKRAKPIRRLTRQVDNSKLETTWLKILGM